MYLEILIGKGCYNHYSIQNSTTAHFHKPQLPWVVRHVEDVQMEYSRSIQAGLVQYEFAVAPLCLNWNTADRSYIQKSIKYLVL